MNLFLLGLVLSCCQVVLCEPLKEGTNTTVPVEDKTDYPPSCEQTDPQKNAPPNVPISTTGIAVETFMVETSQNTTGMVDMTPEERKAILQAIIAEAEVYRQGRPQRREEKLSDMLEGWKDLYARDGNAAIHDFYQTARQEIFTWKKDGSPNDDAPENLNETTKSTLLRWLGEWDYLKETYDQEALYHWYRATMFEVFRMPEIFVQDNEGTLADGDDPWHVSDAIDSQHGTVFDISEYHECELYTDPSIEYYNDPDVWRFIRQIYEASVGPGKSTILDLYGTGYQVKVKFDYSEGKGRGLFAAEDIPKDTVIWRESYIGQFDNGSAFRKFLLALPPKIACDYLQWSYVFADDQFDLSTLRMGADLDGAGFTNTGYEVGEVNMVSLGLATGVNIATRDIKAGEEILVDYNEYGARLYRWNYFGLTDYWEEDDFDAALL